MARALTHNEQMLRTVRQAINDCVVGGTKSATIAQGGGSKSFTRHSLDELEKLEVKYVNRVNRERGGKSRRKPDFGSFG